MAVYVESKSSKLGIPAGTAGSPSLYFQTNTDTGVYSSGGEFSIAVNGNGKLGVSENQITTTVGLVLNPSNSILPVSGSNVACYLSKSLGLGVSNWNLYSNGSAPNYFNGSVGIGTPTPSSKLDVNGVITVSAGSGSAPAIISGTGTSDTGIFWPEADTLAISTAGSERVRVTSDGAVEVRNSTTPTLTLYNTSVNVAGGDTLGSLGFYSSDATVNATGLRAFVRAIENDDGFGRSYDMTFGTGEVADATEKVRITKNGRVGIGRTLPASALDVNGVITVSAGSGSAGSYLPSVVFTGDPNTGIQQIGGSDTFSIVTGGHERLQIGSGGNIGITTASTATSKFAIGGTISGTGTNFISLAAGTAQSAVTQLWAYYTSPAVASDCALTNLVHYGAQQGTISGTVTTQIGFYAVSTLTSGTNNFGFRGDLTSGTGRWNFYANGNANNYFAGNVGIGSGRTSPTSALDVNGVITVSAGSAAAPALTFKDDTDTGVYRAGVNSLAFSTNGTEQIRIGPDGEVGIGMAGASSIGLRIKHDPALNNIIGTVLNVHLTSSALVSYGYWTAPSLLNEDTAYTSHVHYIANFIPTTPNNSSMVLEVAFQAGNSIQPHAVRSFVSSLNAGVGLDRYAFLASGSAPSLFNGTVWFASGAVATPSIAFSSDTNTGLFAPSADNLAITTGGTERMRIKSNGVVRFIPLSADPASAEEGDMYFNSTSKKLKVYDGTSWVDLH